MINTPAEATGEYKEMLVRLLTRQIYAETATSEVFEKAITAAPNWQEKELAAEFAAEGRHARGLYDILTDLGEDPEAIIAGRPDAEEYWSFDLSNWLDIAVFNFTVDRAGSHQIMEYRQSSYVPWGESQEEVLEDEKTITAIESKTLNSSQRTLNVHACRKFLIASCKLQKTSLRRLEGPDNEFCLQHGLKRHTTEEIINRLP